ncbi:flavin reductase [Paludicola sp. MB14-C6]|uniref:flavin reductase n=1 Tax=Paludihabitans sp. MB14-C6 TaxID=3070656 RepID=UPI0027DB71E6|nr:flavin reductase [Paludicola sp. MB14-C6]WMJ22501.1 flavin reductase [Paludicola sp. MB14-C6]
MYQFQEHSCKELNNNPFHLIGDEWMLVTSGNEQSYNTMTASWGGLGVLWGKNVATIYIRPQRYTYEFIEKNEYFTLAFFDESYKKALGFCGKYSGRDYDKAKECNLTPMPIEQTIAFEEAKLVLVCKKLYHQDIDPENFYDASIENNYANKDYHRMYIGEIVKVLVK